LGVRAGDLPSVVGRHLARALEAKRVADAMANWLLELDVDEPAAADVEVPESSQGAGVTDAARGALGHWIRIREGRIDNYQLVVPTTWNAGPMDAEGNPGPIEQALIGTSVKDEANPFEVVRIVRSFDPCLACAVHIVDLSGNTKHVARAL
jgi:hydrogenase large subunit